MDKKKFIRACAFVINTLGDPEDLALITLQEPENQEKMV